MIRIPEWLPQLVCVNPWTEETFEILYRIFTRDFKTSQPSYRGHAVWLYLEMDAGKEIIFWHLTHRKDNTTGNLLPDLRRSERLPWVRKIIENSTQSEVLAWDYLESGGKVHTYIWLKDHNFLVLMKKYSNGQRRLITSYHVDFSHKRKKLQKKFAKRIK